MPVLDSLALLFLLFGHQVRWGGEGGGGGPCREGNRHPLPKFTPPVGDQRVRTQLQRPKHAGTLVSSHASKASKPRSFRNRTFGVPPPPCSAGMRYPCPASRQRDPAIGQGETTTPGGAVLYALCGPSVEFFISEATLFPPPCAVPVFFCPGGLANNPWLLSWAGCGQPYFFPMSTGGACRRRRTKRSAAGSARARGSRSAGSAPEPACSR